MDSKPSVIVLWLLIVLLVFPCLAKAAETTNGSGVGFSYGECSKPAVSDVQPDKRVVGDEIAGPLEVWLASSLSWQIAYWLLLAGSILFSSIAASGLVADVAPVRFKSVFALVATLASALVATFNPQARADQYMDGYVFLKSAIVRFHNDGNMTSCDLAAAYAAAEGLVHHRNPPSAVGPSK